jgi:hypothetical protein
MSSEMKQLRKEDLSLYYYLKDVVLRDFIELEEEVPLSYMSEISSNPIDQDCEKSLVYEALSTMEPRPTDRGRGWVYFDENHGFDSHLCAATVSGLGIPEQKERVIVYSCTMSGGVQQLTPIHWSDYMVDYMDGRVVTSGTCATPKYVTYYWNYIALVDEWAAIQASDPPVVVIDIHGTDKMGYQLGAGKKSVRKVDLHIFATNPPERNDIVETLYDGLFNRSCPIYDFPEGTVLDYDGTWYGRKENPDRNDASTYFNTSTVSGIIGNMLFDNVTARNVNLPMLMTRNTDEIMLSDLNAYRSKISFELVSYTQS